MGDGESSDGDSVESISENILIPNQTWSFCFLCFFSLSVCLFICLRVVEKKLPLNFSFLILHFDCCLFLGRFTIYPLKTLFIDITINNAPLFDCLHCLSWYNHTILFLPSMVHIRNRFLWLIFIAKGSSFFCWQGKNMDVPYKLINSHQNPVVIRF